MRSLIHAPERRHRTLGAAVPALLLTAACSSSSGVGATDVDAASDAPHVSSGGFDAGHDVAADHVPDGGHTSTTSGGQTSSTPSSSPSSSSPSSSSSGSVGHDAGDAMTTPPDGGNDAAMHDGSTPVDAGRDVFVRNDASDAGPGIDTGVDVYVPTVDASVCPNGMGTIAILGGTANLAFGATSRNGEPWRLTSFARDSVDSTPALVSYGTGFLGLFSQSGTTDIESTLWSSGPQSWSTPGAVPAQGGGAATELGSPSLSVRGADAELVYQGSNNLFYHGEYATGAWGAAGDAVGGMVSQDFGPSPPSSASAGGVLYAGYDGSDNGLYVDTWTPAGGWAGASPIMGAGVGAVPPTMVALTGGSSDVMIVFVQQSTNFLYSVVHSASSGWAAPVQVSSTAIAQTPVSLAALPGGGVVMVYEGTNSLPYGAAYNASASTWSTPTGVYPNSLPLQSPPSVATGVCGVDAVVALTEVEGVEIVTFTDGVWSPPVLINGTSQIQYAAIATSSTTSAPLPDGSAPRDAGEDHHSGDATMMMGRDAGHDSGTDAHESSDASDASATFDCPGGSGTVALVGGSSIAAYGATSKSGGKWKVAALGAETVGTIPALVAYKAGFLSLFSESLTNIVESTVFTSTWSAPAALGTTGGGTASELGGPAISVVGSDVEFAYLGTDNNLYHAEYTAGAWGLASDPIADMGKPHDTSPSQPTAATVGSTLFVAYDGGDNGLYVETWTEAGGWANEQPIFGAGVGTTPPTLIPLTSSGAGSPDLMLVFEFLDTNYIFSSVHTSGGDAGPAGAWGPVQQIDPTANTFNQVSLAALPGGDVELVYQGEDGNPYASRYTASTATWAAPSSVYGGGGTLVSAPGVATGVCGYDAIAALVLNNGVQVTTLKDGAWSTPALVEGLSGMTFASIATHP